MECLADIKLICDSSGCSFSIIGGDFNADTGNEFHTLLDEFCNDESFCIFDEVFFEAKNQGNVATFYSDAHGTSSWLDHIICSVNAKQFLDDVSVLQDYLSSDHFPLALTVNINIETLSAADLVGQPASGRISWSSLSTLDIARYQHRLRLALSDVSVFNCITCQSCNLCDVEVHKRAITEYAQSISNALNNSASCLIDQGTCHRASNRNMCGWNDHVRGSYRSARQAFLSWVSHGRPLDGPLYDERRRMRAWLKRDLRRCRANKEALKSSKLAEAALCSDSKKFWKLVKKEKSSSVPCSSRIGDSCGPSDICTMWKNFYNSIFNSVSDSNACDLYFHGDLSFTRVSIEEVMEAVSQLDVDKACGLDLISPGSIKFSVPELSLHLENLFNLFISHSFVPEIFSDVYITPILKDKNSCATATSNYRPIAVSSTVSKIFEVIIRGRMLPFSCTTDNQMSYKPGVGTETCVFLLKEVVRSYLRKSSFVHAAFLDSSKAFDRVNHRKLLTKLADRHVPSYILNLLSNWYSSQRMSVKWDGCISSPFLISNGVRQGSLLSPLLFSLYMDDLSAKLNLLSIGCFSGSAILNHILYADDITLLSPSIHGLRKLLSVCESYALDFDITFNGLKSKAITFCKKRLDFTVGSVVLCKDKLAWSESVKYLGIKLHWSLDDRFEINSQLRNFYCRSNFIVRRFSRCTTAVKLKLFEAFCSSVYLIHLWLSYPKSVLSRFRIAYNNTLRKLIGLPRHCSASEMHVFFRVCSFDARMRRARASFHLRIHRLDNRFVRSFICSQEYFDSIFRIAVLQLTLI